MVDVIRAWHPEVPQVQEVLHARFDHHAYPAHTHDSWTVLLLDEGAVTYDLDRHDHLATPAAVTLLPPQVPHDGRSALADQGFRKRVLYLDPEWLPQSAVVAAADAPTLLGTDALTTVTDIHSALADPADAFAAECGVLALRETALSRLTSTAETASDAPLARRLREMLDDRLLESFTIAEAAAQLGAHRSHLVRVFTSTFGIAPHRYVIGRRVDRARRLLLSGHSPAEAAAESGFHDQAHLTRHFRSTLGTTPGVFAA
ncbi:helix-turn-helix transcriptional regulator [Brevibacterium spongiae]|uniref:AraC family transcriptional regulator n=1 Tax=Brevibacterium spongiae TaxID=2909672 RepID=A0ABY5SR74_9MICO|nr:AraC family transcriptional regulator [Brevibacterium spongiae]UVI36704.1 AraC family transcriptional regulator [Brevibacterium spongiae]